MSATTEELKTQLLKLPIKERAELAQYLIDSRSWVPSPVKTPEKVDMVIFRENTEDIYAGIEYAGGTPEAQKVLEGWRERIAGLGSADDFNGALADVKAAPKAAQAMFADAAKVNGLAWDKAAGKYAEAVPA